MSNLFKHEITIKKKQALINITKQVKVDKMTHI